jgi:hypothetical protein
MNTNIHTETPGKEDEVVHPAAITPGPEEELDAPLVPVTAEAQVTPPRTREAIDELNRYEYDPYERNATTGDSDETAAVALIMFGQASIPAELPKLRTEKWPYAGKKPNPISIGTAKKLLAAAYAVVPCAANEAGVHGYAWMIEDDKVWVKRAGVGEMSPPVKPKEIQAFDVKAQWEYMRMERRYVLYNHLVQEGKAKY